MKMERRWKSYRYRGLFVRQVFINEASTTSKYVFLDNKLKLLSLSHKLSVVCRNLWVWVRTRQGTIHWQREWGIIGAQLRFERHSSVHTTHPTLVSVCTCESLSNLSCDDKMTDEVTPHLRTNGLSLAETASRSLTSLFSLTDRVSPRLRGFKVQGELEGAFSTKLKF